MRLDRFHIQGFRSLSDVRDIPLRSPTILTGQNDGGKSATLVALEFLLNGQAPAIEDHTFLSERQSGVPDGGSSEDAETNDLDRRAPEVVVTGEFHLSAAEQEDLALPEMIRLRRRVTGTDAPVYEVLRRVPEDEDLRDVEQMRMADPKELATRREIKPDGPANTLESWRKPLRALAASDTQVDDWAHASRDLIARLPLFLPFSSTDELDPEAEVRSVLQVSYQRMLEDPELVGPVRELEGTITAKLQDEAEQLCAHIQGRVPELTSVSAVPTLSFRHGLSSVQLRACKGNEDVGLRQAGSGRQRRITLAVWEWTSLPVARVRRISVIG